MTSLFNLTEDYKQIYDLIAEQGDEDVLSDTLDSVNDALENKADGYVAVIRKLEGDNHIIDEEIKRLKQRKNTNANGIQRLKERLQDSMERTGKTKFRTSLNSFTLANNKPSLDITDESMIPQQYYEEQQPKLNKQELLQYVKDNGEFRGVHLKQTRSLRVR